MSLFVGKCVFFEFRILHLDPQIPITSHTWDASWRFVSLTKIPKTIKNVESVQRDQKAPKVTPKVIPDDSQRRLNGHPKATNGAPGRPRGAQMDSKEQMEPQWPSEGTQGSPRVPKEHRRQA